jgi:hypothetical protein
MARAAGTARGGWAPAAAAIWAVMAGRGLPGAGHLEKFAGLAVMLQDNLAVPFQTAVLGVTVIVRKIDQTESGIVAICVRGKHRQAIPVLDLPLPDPPGRGAKWIAAYRHWAG